MPLLSALCWEDEGRGEIFAGKDGRQRFEWDRGRVQTTIQEGWQMVKESWDRWSVGANGFLDPGSVFADLRVDSWVLSRAAGVNTPGKDALQGLITDQGATGVTLEVGGRRDRTHTPM